MQDPSEAVEILENLPLKHQVYGAAREAGFSNTETSKALEISRQNGNVISRKLDKYKLTGNVKLAKHAAKAVENIIQGKAFGDIKGVKASDAMRAAEMWYDRNDAVIRAQDAPTTNNYTQININVSNGNRGPDD